MTHVPTQPSPARESARNRRYVVTGAGSGIGLATARALAEAGHHVYAGARRDDDLARLAAVPGVVPVRLDVRRAEDVAALRTRLTADAATAGLDGLVNNAGIGELGHLAAWQDDDVQRLFETNVFGPMRLVRELLPLLIAARGRIVNIGSMGGQITMPMYGPYTMTKHALEAFSECLRQELEPHGVAVSIVQPGAVSTRIGATAMPATLARLEATPPPFDTAARQVLSAMQAPPPPADDDAPESVSHRKPAAAEAVAEVVLRALFVDAPLARYLVGTRWEGERVLQALAERLVDAATSTGQQLDRGALLGWVERVWSQRARRKA